MQHFHGIYRASGCHCVMHSGERLSGDKGSIVSGIPGRGEVSGKESLQIMGGTSV